MVALTIAWGPGAAWGNYGLGGGSDTHLLNDVNDVVGWAFQAPQAGVIDQVSFNVTARTAPTQNWNVAIVTLDATGGPTTTPYGGSAVVSTTITGTGRKTVSFPTPATVARGDLFGVRIWCADGAPTGSVTIRTVMDNTVQGWEYPVGYRSTDAGATWTIREGVPVCSVRYDDGVYLWPDADDTASTPTAFHSGSSPDEYGFRFQIPFNAVLSGIAVHYLSLPSQIPVTLHVYDSGGTELATATMINPDASTQTQNALFDIVPGLALAPNADYYVAITNSSGVTTCRAVKYWQLQTAAERGSYIFGDGMNWARATRTDAGAWTIDTTQLPMAALYLSEVSAP